MGQLPAELSRAAARQCRLDRGAGVVIPEELEKLDPADDDDVTIELHNAYRAGRKEALLQAIEHSVLNRKPIPRWARQAFDEAYTRVMMGDARSWDVVFGKPHLGKHQRTSQQANRKV